MSRCKEIGNVVCRGMVLWVMAMAIGISANVAAVEAPASGLLPDLFIPFEPESGPEYVLVVEKETQSLFVYEIASPPEMKAQWSCSTGKQAGPKARSGDGKTPEGIYFFTKIHEDNELAPIYGIRAFPTDYPNLLDRIAEKTGSAIWLHGTNKALKPMDSNGCIVLDNADLKKAETYISLNRTPIIIVDRINNEAFEPKNALKEEIFQIIDHWIDAVDQGTYHEYVGLYDPEYVPDIAWWSDWQRLQKGFRDSETPLKVQARNIALYKHESVVVALFDQHLHLSGRDIPVGAKKLFLSDKGAGLRIIGESYQSLPGGLQPSVGENPLILASGGIRIQGPDEADIEAVVDEWLKAWSSMDIADYGFFYAEDFQSQGMDKAGWLDYKKNLNRKYDFIRITKKDFKAETGNDRSKVTFIQNYQSSGFKASGLKTLILKRENGEWKIFRETWSRM